MESHHQNSTTTILLLLIHTIFINQVLKNYPRKKVLVSYTILTRKRQWYRALFALLSHPPTRESSQNHSRQMNNNSGCGPIINIFHRIQDWYRSSIFSNGRRLSGLPLMFYNCFVLWNCRALEPLMGSYQYFRVLWALCVISLLLDLCFTNTALNIIRDMNHGTSTPFGTNFSPSRAVPQRVERILSHRTIGRYVHTDETLQYTKKLIVQQPTNIIVHTTVLAVFHARFLLSFMLISLLYHCL